jgi:hypothetical protein
MSCGERISIFSYSHDAQAKWLPSLASLLEKILSRHNGHAFCIGLPRWLLCWSQSKPRVLGTSSSAPDTKYIPLAYSII